MGGYTGSPVWSPEGKRLLFYETDEIGGFLAQDATSRGSRTEIVSVDIATGVRHVYTASNETKLSPQWLPQGKISYILRSKDANEGLKV